MNQQPQPVQQWMNAQPANIRELQLRRVRDLIFNIKATLDKLRLWVRHLNESDNYMTPPAVGVTLAEANYYHAVVCPRLSDFFNDWDADYSRVFLSIEEALGSIIARSSNIIMTRVAARNLVNQDPEEVNIQTGARSQEAMQKIVAIQVMASAAVANHPYTLRLLAQGMNNIRAAAGLQPIAIHPAAHNAPQPQANPVQPAAYNSQQARATQPWTMDDILPLDRITAQLNDPQFQANPMAASFKKFIIFRDTPGWNANNGLRRDRYELLKQGWLPKLRCLANLEEQEHGQWVRCDEYPVSNSDYCWYHLKNYWNLEIRRTEQHDPQTGQRLRLLGVFAVRGKRVETPRGQPLFRNGQMIIPITCMMGDRAAIIQYHAGIDPPYILPLPNHIVPPAHMPNPAFDGSIYRDTATMVQSCGPQLNNKRNVVVEELKRTIQGNNGNVYTTTFPGLVATKDIHDGDELLVFKHDGFRPDQSAIGLHYATVQVKNPPRNPRRVYYQYTPPRNPVFREGEPDANGVRHKIEIGQKYVHRYIPKSFQWAQHDMTHGRHISRGGWA